MISGIDIQEMNKSRQPQQERPGDKMKDHIKREDEIGNGLSFVGKQRQIKGKFWFPGFQVRSLKVITPTPSNNK